VSGRSWPSPARRAPPRMAEALEEQPAAPALLTVLPEDFLEGAGQRGASSEADADSVDRENVGEQGPDGEEEAEAEGAPEQQPASGPAGEPASEPAGGPAKLRWDGIEKQLEKVDPKHSAPVWAHFRCASGRARVRSYRSSAILRCAEGTVPSLGCPLGLSTFLPDFSAVCAGRFARVLRTRSASPGSRARSSSSAA
jgi:hypothetical protein